MKTILLNRFQVGGAANSCYRLADGLCQLGLEVDVLTESDYDIHEDSFFSHPRLQSYLENVRFLKKYGCVRKSLYQERDSRFEKLTYLESPFRIHQHPLVEACDIINLHWVAGFLDYESFFKVVRKPIVWTLHDMHAFSGGEYYEERIVGVEKRKFVRKPLSDMEHQFLKTAQRIKKGILKGAEDLTVVTPSHWLADKAHASTAFEGRKIEVIPYGIDTRKFTMKGQQACRELLGTASGKSIFLMVADKLDKTRKGTFLLPELLKETEETNFEIWLLGGDVPAELKNDTRVRCFGFIYDENLLSMIYSAADYYFMLSLEDNLPNTVIEALLCGTPVWGLPIGGVKEMVNNGINGILSAELSFDSILDTFLSLVRNLEPLNREQISKDARSKYELNRQAAAYIALMKGLVD